MSPLRAQLRGGVSSRGIAHAGTYGIRRGGQSASLMAEPLNVRDHKQQNNHLGEARAIRLLVPGEAMTLASPDRVTILPRRAAGISLAPRDRDVTDLGVSAEILRIRHATSTP